MVQISQRGKAYLETAWTWLRAAQTMTDSAIASHLKILADDYERRAKKGSHGQLALGASRDASCNFGASGSDTVSMRAQCLSDRLSSAI